MRTMSRAPNRSLLRFTAATIAFSMLLLIGCSKDAERPGALGGPTAVVPSASQAAPPAVIDQRGDAPPAGVIEVAAHATHLHMWPYTGDRLNESAKDPINLLFFGNADPRSIRSTLLNLDGDRSAFGFPNAPPWNQRWTDAYGDVQTAWADGEGWTASVVQLALGDFEPLRFHLRLFRTSQTPGAWTLGAAHFEVLIPGTFEHQVLSWQCARDLVMADLLRAGIVVGAPDMTGPITQTPSYREVMAVIYNGLPPELRAYIGGPLADVAEDWPIPNDGRAAVLTLGGTPDCGCPQSQSFTIQVAQAVPKPICSDGPGDWVYIEGPVAFTRNATVDEAGVYSYTAHASGRLSVTPIDLSTNPPTPLGPSYMAIVSEDQEGSSSSYDDRAMFRYRRIAAQEGGAERLTYDLKVAWNGEKKLRITERCLEPEP